MGSSYGKELECWGLIKQTGVRGTTHTFKTKLTTQFLIITKPLSIKLFTFLEIVANRSCFLSRVVITANVMLVALRSRLVRPWLSVTRLEASADAELEFLEEGK